MFTDLTAHTMYSILFWQVIVYSIKYVVNVACKMSCELILCQSVASDSTLLLIMVSEFALSSIS